MKVAIIFFSVCFLVLAGCRNKPAELKTDVKSDVEINPEFLIHEEFDVMGMTCTGCENTIKTGISEYPGIDEVTASYLEGKVLVSYDSSMVKSEDIEAAIIMKGYKVAGKADVPVND